jgi:hypothetical protein
MTITNTSQGSMRGLPKPLQIAQEAITLPEVQEMLRRLSEYHLGICMPHMHDEKSGDFRLLPDDVTQLDSGLQVSFGSAQTLENQTEPFLPTSWFWRGSAPTAVAVCEMVGEISGGEIARYDKHKMLEGRSCSSSL